MRATRLIGGFGLAIATLVSTAACDRETASAYRSTATVEEIMRVIVDPSADAIWDAVVTDATADGIIEIRPETADDWARLRHHALIIAEATNLLMVEGRRIAARESRSELPGIDLHPDAIQELVAGNWGAWVETARGLHEASVIVLEAIDAREVDALLAAGTALDLACENCHSRYWYPGVNDPRPADPER